MPTPEPHGCCAIDEQERQLDGATADERNRYALLHVRLGLIARGRETLDADENGDLAATDRIRRLLARYNPELEECECQAILAELDERAASFKLEDAAVREKSADLTHCMR